MKDTELKEIRDNVAIIFVIHEFYAEWLNSNYKEVIQTIMKDVIGYEVEPKFFTAEQLAELDETSRKSNTPSEPQRQIIEYGHEGTDHSILTIHLILSSLDLAIDFHTQQVLQLLKHQHKHTTPIYIWWRWSW